MTTAPKPGAISRRKMLRAAGALGVGAAAAGWLAGPTSYAIAGNPTKIRLSWTEFAACHSPVAFARGQGHLREARSRRRTVLPGRQRPDADPVDRHQQDRRRRRPARRLGQAARAGPRRQAVRRLAWRLHSGCWRRRPRASTTLEGLKGKTIVSYDVASPPKHSFQVALAKAGLDPERDVTWTNVPFDLVGETVARGDADALGASRSLGLLAQEEVRPHRDRQHPDRRLRGPYLLRARRQSSFLDANKDALRRLAEANIEIHEYTANHPDEVAKWFVENLNPGFPVADINEQVVVLGAAQPSDRQAARRAGEASPPTI